jgi:hypothetical protein
MSFERATELDLSCGRVIHNGTCDLYVQYRATKRCLIELRLRLLNRFEFGKGIDRPTATDYDCDGYHNALERRTQIVKSLVIFGQERHRQLSVYTNNVAWVSDGKHHYL